MHQILGDNIQKLRKESGLTQEKLAALLGVSFQAVSRWENGVEKDKQPSFLQGTDIWYLHLI